MIHDLCHGICQKHFIITQQSIQRNKESMLKLPAIAQFLVEIKVENDPCHTEETLTRIVLVTLMMSSKRPILCLVKDG